MKHPPYRRSLFPLAICWAMLTLWPHALYAENAPSVAQIIVASGEVAARNEAGATRALTRRSDLHRGDTVVTGNGSRTQLRFVDGAVVSLDENSELQIEDYRHEDGAQDRRAVLRLVTGGLRTLTGTITEKDPEAYELKTPLAHIGIRGTDYQIVLSERGMAVAIWSGRIRVSNAGGTVDLGADVDFRFALIESADTAPKGLLQLPPELHRDLPMRTDQAREGYQGYGHRGPDHDSHSSFDTEEERLLEARQERATEETPRQSWLPLLDRRGLLAFSDVFSPGLSNFAQGQSNRLTTGDEPFVLQNAEILISLDPSGLSNFQENVNGFSVNWGVWNGEPTFLIHEDEYDEEGASLDFTAPVYLASVESISLDDIQGLKGTTGMLMFGDNLRVMGHSNNEWGQSGFDENFSSGSFQLDLNTGAIEQGQLVLPEEGLDFNWSLNFSGQLSGSQVSLTTEEVTYSGQAAFGDLEGLFTTRDDDMLGFLGSFELHTDDGQSTAAGFFLMEEAAW